ncbi:hypothetical protein [Nocardia macrotermitis]|uniref:Uncharacterized protein n=1 Tax=Nocardia macrotermitis TaxID=2585198 RepID=A0A7K0DEJ3_9NOCA|nr:hypothetical protein [Nocardia macrotermitis]MQY24137.1 hypothetical protein [Nocardia macrotermitis]
MVARTLDTVEPGVRAIRSAADARAHACRHRLRYRVAIFASNVIDAVHSVGGWVFDRTMAGWEVTVMVPDLVNPAPLQLLGAIVLNLEDALGSPPNPAPIWPHELVVAATVFDSDDRVRAGVTANLEAHAEEIMFWGRCDGRARGIEHRLSAAARAFKANALTLAGEPSESFADVETFHRRGPAHGVTGDLVQLGSRPRGRDIPVDPMSLEIRPEQDRDAVVIDITRRARRLAATESDR